MERDGSTVMDLSIAANAPALTTPTQSWQQRLNSIIEFHDKVATMRFIDETARSALEAVAAQMRESGPSPELKRGEEHIDLSVPHGEFEIFRYTIWSRSYRAPSFAFSETRKAGEGQPKHYRAMAQTTEVDQPHDVTGYTRDQVINELLNRYARFRHTRRQV